MPYSLYTSPMREFRIKKIIPLALIIFALLSVWAVFWSRPPVLIVTDSSFQQLYGTRRLFIKNAIVSLQLFRRVIPVTVAETAGPDLVALAAEKGGRTAAAVIFPYRYLEGARLFVEKQTETPVLVSGGGGITSPEAFPFTVVRIDTAVDLYRAGFCAAILAGGKQITVLSNGETYSEYRDAFQEGLRDGNFPGGAVYMEASTDFSEFSGSGCVVVLGTTAKFLEQNHTVPVILFS